MLLTALAPMIWGSTYLITTELLPADRPLLAATIRCLPAGLLFILFTRKLPAGSWWWKSAVLAVLNIAAFQPLIFITAYRLPGGVGAIVAALGPFVVAALSYPLLRLAPAPRTLIASVFGLIGVALVVLRATAVLDTLGLAAGAAGTVVMALGTVLGRKWGAPQAGLLALTGWQLAIGGALLLPLTLAVEGLPGELNGKNLAGYGYLVVFGAMLSYALWFRGVAKLAPARVSMLGLMSPVVAAVLGWVVLGQALTGWQLLGAALVIGSVVWGAMAPARKAPVAEVREPALVR
ncbi:EamA family transporter [Longispora albida]|uniref:EamA family transporter n=1 Tax=Longispora albida TaxID=203523 RepID=UPI0003719911|nr:EamA family transporter [Longispora albida]